MTRRINIYYDDALIRTLRRANRRYLSEAGLEENEWKALSLSRDCHRSFLPLTHSGKRLSYVWPHWAAKVTNQLDRAPSWNLKQDRFDQALLHCNGHLLHLNAAIDDAIATCQLDGIRVDAATAQRALREEKRPIHPHERLLYSTFHAIRSLHEIKDKPLSVPLLEGLYRQVSENAGSGILNVESSDLDAFLTFVNQDSKSQFVHPLIKAAIIELWIHLKSPWPSNEGNGIIARLLFRWFLLKHRYEIVEALSLSRILFRSRMAYKNSLHLVSAQNGDATYFLNYTCRSTSVAILGLHRTIRKLRKAADLSRETVSEHKFNRRQWALLVKATQVENVSYTTGSYAREFKTSVGTARNDLIELVKQGLLKQESARNRIVFRPSESLAEKLNRSS